MLKQQQVVIAASPRPTSLPLIMRLKEMQLKKMQLQLSFKQNSGVIRTDRWLLRRERPRNRKIRLRPSCKQIGEARQHGTTSRIRLVRKIQLVRKMKLVSKIKHECCFALHPQGGAIAED